MKDGALKENGDRRHVNDVWGKVKSPEPPNRLSAGDSGTERTVRRVSMLAAVLLPSVQPCCYRPEQHISPLELFPAVLALLELPEPPRLPLPPFEHGPLPSDAGPYGPCYPSTSAGPLGPTLEGALMPPCGGRLAPAHSFSIGELRPTLPLIFFPPNVPVRRYLYGPLSRARIVGGRGTLAGPARRCGMYGTVTLHVSAPLSFSIYLVFVPLRQKSRSFKTFA